ncbi:uncharacterized protein LOC106646379, partial [Copidosoma floridanum]|uniref:uncharacterized protein LOC106646379 n=1 Tax=Copidosoma floridanum TaxID=29053 RepID=UPI0006C97389
ALRRYGTLSSLDQDDDLEEQLGEEESGVESPPSGLRGWSLRATSYVVSKMSILEHFNEGCFLQAPVPPERTECSSLDPNSNGDEEGTTSGGTSGDDIWGTPTSGGPDDESFTGSPVRIHENLVYYRIYVNTGYGGASGPLGLDSPDDDSPTTVIDYHVANTTHSNNQQQREITGSPEIYRSTQQLAEEHQHQRSGENSLEAERPIRDVVDAEGDEDGNHHLAQWVRNSHQIPPPDQEALIEEWTPEELAARTPKESNSSTRDLSEAAEESTMANSDAEQQSSASSASISTVKSNSKPAKKNGVAIQPRDAPSPPLPSSVINSINMCRKCHSNMRRRSGCPTPPARDPFSPLPPKISVMPPTPDLCFRHRGGPKNAGLHDSPGRSYSADGTNEDGSEDDLDCDGDPPYRFLCPPPSIS